MVERAGRGEGDAKHHKRYSSSDSDSGSSSSSCMKFWLTRADRATVLTGRSSISSGRLLSRELQHNKTQTQNKKRYAEGGLFGETRYRSNGGLALQHSNSLLHPRPCLRDTNHTVQTTSPTNHRHSLMPKRYTKNSRDRVYKQ